jgi:hypothetical protein
VVIFLVRTAAGKFNAILLAPALEGMVDKLAAVVGVKDADREGEERKGVVQSLKNPGKRLVFEGVMDHPTGCQFGNGQRITKPAFRVASVMLNEVDLSQAGLLLLALKAAHDRDEVFEVPGAGRVPQVPLMRTCCFVLHNRRSIVAALMRESFPRTAGVRANRGEEAMRPTLAWRKGAGIFPHRQLKASRMGITASLTASS